MFYNRLKDICQLNGTSVTAICKKIGVGTANGTYWKNGSTPNGDILIQLSESLNVSIDYLLTGKKTYDSYGESDLISKYNLLDSRGKGAVNSTLEYELQWAEKKKQAKPKVVPPVEDAIVSETKSIPVYFQPAAAGTGNFLDSEDYDLVDIPIDNVPIQTTFGVRVCGDSMEPDYLGGDIVFVKQQPTLEYGEIGVFVLPQDGAVIKKYHKAKRGDELLSLNVKYKPIRIYADNIPRIVGKVIGKLSNE